MFENKTTKGIHYSRFIASWCNSGGTLDRKGRYRFKKWLNSLTDEITASEIYDFATNGKLELEENAKDFIANK